jgi:Na+-transporting methylmalonyl-CoA/oxaloacetate decarboxylase gamma subunit
VGVENIMAGDGIGIAVTGMLVVVAGLILISVFIAALPRLFRWAGRARGPAHRSGRGSVDPEAAASESPDPELAAALAYVVEAERQRAEDRQRITMREDGEQAVWTAIGKMRTLSRRL